MCQSSPHHSIGEAPQRRASHFFPPAAEFATDTVRSVSALVSQAAQTSAGKAQGSGDRPSAVARVAFSRNLVFSSSRRVVVKAADRAPPGPSLPLRADGRALTYLKREGVTRDGETARMFDAETDRADDAAFADRSKEDRHHFRFILSPEDAAEMADLKAFTRGLARQMESDLGTRSRCRSPGRRRARGTLPRPPRAGRGRAEYRS
jgi:hypothetical protein